MKRFLLSFFLVISLSVPFCMAAGEGEPVVDMSSTAVVTSLAPVTPSNSNGLVKVIVSLIGDYDPVVVEHIYTTSNGYTQKTIEIQPDYTWLVSAGIFALVLYCIFRMWGSFFCNL